jgi:pimeloyl-ACP methyl ester carboxylesterase
MPTTRNDGVRIAYDVTLPSDTEAVVFVEGWSYGRWMWRWQRAALTEYTTVVADNRGTGDTEAPGLGMPSPLDRLPKRLRQPFVYLLHREKYTIARLAADLEAVLADLGVDDAHVVGASMGGMVALQHALTYDRTASLTLMCTTAGGEMADLVPEETMAHLESVPDGLDERERLEYLMEPATTDAWRSANGDLIDDIVEWRRRQDASAPAREAQAMGQLGYDLRDRLGEVAVPTLVMHGTADRVVPFERGEELADGLDCAFEVYEDAPHLFFIERAEAVNERLRAFLDGATERSE